MEKYQAKLVKELDGKLLFPLLCTGTTGMKDGVTEAIKEKVYLKDALEQFLGLK